MDYDFSGWATKTNVQCMDGRTILPGAFRDQDGKTVPVVWNHQHNDPDDVLGHALLENRDDGVYAYISMNGSTKAQRALENVKHGDVDSLSIWANELQYRGRKDLVSHGNIREVSLVLAGANPGARIENVLAHSADGSEVELDDEAVMFFNQPLTFKDVQHADPSDDSKDDDDETVQDIVNSMTDKQKNVMYGMVAMALETADAGGKNDEGGEDMKHNAFSDAAGDDLVLSAEEMQSIFADGKRYGSLKDAVLAHGITNIDYLFPEAKTLEKTPGFIQRPQEWVSTVMNGVRHTPFSRIKTMFADITADEARAKGYIKGHQKTEEVFPILKRSTTPTTIYKKQKLDRDDVVDIVDFDVVAWLKTEMRGMLDEELARAFLIGDGRLASSDDHINEQNIRPIAFDDDLYNIKQTLTTTSSMTDDAKAKAFIRLAVKARKNYRGSGNPTLFTTEDMLINLQLLEDNNGRIIYESMDKLKSVLRVSNIVTVPVMENATNSSGNKIIAIIVNLSDYAVGADKGGAVNMFDDFDIDYNAQKYLIETRCSGALIKPYSAITITEATASSGGETQEV